LTGDGRWAKNLKLYVCVGVCVCLCVYLGVCRCVGGYVQLAAAAVEQIDVR